ncbi:MspA family porin [Gordonia sp. TBRC 11910]|uniref:MspA family porin n=1 Tax=Gordonia asplenii TaxID=2725283 RepID=A0A848KX71_9ACTN|nr:MspA family porin [Gordonia asplenii]NMO00058.1 MspA family porin [Gordonia asplenii]
MTRSFITRIGVPTVTATAAVAALSIATPAASANTVRLPAQTKSQQIADGTSVTIERSNERATIAGPMAATPLHRSVVVSGHYSIRLSKKSPTVLLQAGYIVGCQVSVGSLTTTGTGSGADTLATGAVTGSGTAGGSLSLGPGQAATYYLTDFERTDPFGADQHKFYVMYRNTDHAKLNYVNTTIGVNGCAGYAQARSFANVSVLNPTTDQVVTLYGKPFSLG